MLAPPYHQATTAPNDPEAGFQHSCKGRHTVRIERGVTSISWIPSTSMKGIGSLAVKLGVAHDDSPPPEALGSDVEAAVQELSPATGCASPTTCGLPSRLPTMAR